VGRFFDLEKPGQLRKEWHKPAWAFTALLLVGWAVYFSVAGARPATLTVGCFHILLMLLTAPLVVVGILKWEQRNSRILQGSTAAADAERRSRWSGRTGTMLLLVGAGVGYLANSYFGNETMDERGKTMLLAGLFLVPGVLAMFYARTIDDTLSAVPASLDENAIEQWIEEKTSLAHFLRGVLIFLAFIGAIGGALWCFPEVMDADQPVVTGVIIVGALLWVFWKVRHDRQSRSSFPVSRAKLEEVVLGPIDAVRKWQYGLLAAGVVWAFGAFDFIPRNAPPPLDVLPVIGLLAFGAAAVIVGWVARIRS
jgi:hypothetical protein